VALNTGAGAASGNYLLFLDSDCRPQAASYLDEHLATLRKGNDVSLGPIGTVGDGFWGRYQREAVTRRRRQFADGQVFAMTSANMMVRRQHFEQVGGFDTHYRGYGFEDRDLIMRLAQLGARIAYTDTGVLHEADLDLPGVARKMAEAGSLTAPLFREAHPRAYRELGYAMIDATLKPWLWPFGKFMGGAAKFAAPVVDRLLDDMPFALSARLVKLISAMAFMSGTAASR
jgi:hypothetical protein